MIPIGVLVSLAGNLLINLTNMTEVSENFEQSQKLLFSGPFVIQIIGIGMIIPICEELIYRGLIFMRMLSVLQCESGHWLVGASVCCLSRQCRQGIYGFATGVLFAYVYEKYGSLKAPVLVHVSANLMSLGLSYVNPSFADRGRVFIAGIAAAAVCLLMLWAVDGHVATRRIYLNNTDAAAGAQED